mmetsp:Transcript_42671/g.48494  ORF Transcript_42671/g.48494 Transcript_42671/m.48494 type:complete len:80 (+) Transcript_42671:528-767(+)
MSKKPIFNEDCFATTATLLLGAGANALAVATIVKKRNVDSNSTLILQKLKYLRYWLNYFENRFTFIWVPLERVVSFIIA